MKDLIENLKKQDVTVYKMFANVLKSTEKKKDNIRKENNK